MIKTLAQEKKISTIPLVFQANQHTSSPDDIRNKAALHEN